MFWIKERNLVPPPVPLNEPLPLLPSLELDVDEFLSKDVLMYAEQAESPSLTKKRKKIV
jgi:hypothetical protein